MNLKKAIQSAGRWHGIDSKDGFEPMTDEVPCSESEAAKHNWRLGHSSFATLRFSLQRYTFVDYVTQGYIALVGLIILLLHGPRVPLWPFLLLAHAVGLVLIHLLIQLQTRRPANCGLDFLRHIYPILLYSGFYQETGLLSQMLHSGYLDPHFLRLERWMFGWQPGLELMERFPSREVSEVLYAAYFSYYLTVVGVALALLLRDRRQFAHFIAVVSLVFYVCYLTFIFTPVVGPRILGHGIVAQPLPADVTPASPLTTPAAVQAGVFFQIMAWIYQLRSAGRGLPQQSRRSRVVHGLFFVSLPAAHPLGTPGYGNPALHLHRLWPLPLRGGRCCRGADGGYAYSPWQPALFQISSSQ